MKRFAIFFILFCISISVYSQLDSIIVEKYYISGAKDVEDIQYIYDVNDEFIIDSVVLEEGSVTYRIYAVLQPGYSLTSLYGDADHALKISSTQNFFNNTYGGAVLGKDVKSSKFSKSPTLPLDSWLTIGLATSTELAVLKAEDVNGSVLNAISAGFLENNSPDAGIPLRLSDGLVPLNGTSLTWVQNGFKNEDTTIFGSVKVGKEFISHNAYLKNSGLTGASQGKNLVLLAQLTTKGELSFELNIQLSDTSDQSNKQIYYTAVEAIGDSAAGIHYNKYLSYPRLIVCGCNDPDYREYNTGRDCDSPELCKTKIVFGCGDPDACNYDPLVTDFIPELCCYPGRCGDRDISLVCPDLEYVGLKDIKLYPNPVSDILTIEIMTETKAGAAVEIYNSYGTLVKSENLGEITGNSLNQFNLNGFKEGIYLSRIRVGDSVENRIFIKN